MLSCVNWHNFTDVKIINSMVKTNIVQIRMFFIKKSIDLNCATFNDDTGYHIILEFGKQCGYIRILSIYNTIVEFHDKQMIRDK